MAADIAPPRTLLPGSSSMLAMKRFARPTHLDPLSYAGRTSAPAGGRPAVPVAYLNASACKPTSLPGGHVGWWLLEGPCLCTT